MPESEEKSEIVEGRKPESEETQFQMLLQRVIGLDNSTSFTEEQVSEVLAQRKQVTNFIHEDKKRESYDSKFYLVAIMLFILVFSGLVLWKQPEYFSQVLSLIIGLFGGGAGGYSLGKSRN